MKECRHEYLRAFPGKKTTRTFFPLILGILLLLFLISTASGAGVIMRVSTDSVGKQGNGSSSGPSISADGRYVVFASTASNLVPEDNNGRTDIFLKDTQTGQTTIISTDSAGVQGNGNSGGMPSISADGRYVAFNSVATNLVPGDTNSATDVFVKDIQTGETTRISTDSSGGQGNGNSISPSISADGRYVAFSSVASNLVPGDNNYDYYFACGGNCSDIFVKDTLTGTTTMVSTDSAGRQGALDSWSPSISADGRYVAFDSESSLVPEDGYQLWDVFVKDTVTGQTTMVSTDSAVVPGNGYSGFPSISADGRYVAFQSWASNLVQGDTNGEEEVFVKDTLTGQTTRVSTDSAGLEATGQSIMPSISADGRYVTFMSSMNSLVPGDNNGTWDIFVKETETGRTTRVSVDSAGSEGNQKSEYPSISADGRYVAFQSEATNLVPGDTNVQQDVFLSSTSAADVCIASIPPLSLAKTKVYWASYAAYRTRSLSVNYSVAIAGGGAAYEVKVVGSTATNSVTSSTPMPVFLGTIPGGSSLPLTLKYSIPAGVTSFSSTTYVTAKDICGNLYSYPGPYSG